MERPNHLGGSAMLRQRCLGNVVRLTRDGTRCAPGSVPSRGKVTGGWWPTACWREARPWEWKRSGGRNRGAEAGARWWKQIGNRTNGYGQKRQALLDSIPPHPNTSQHRMHTRPPPPLARYSGPRRGVPRRRGPDVASHVVTVLPAVRKEGRGTACFPPRGSVERESPSSPSYVRVSDSTPTFPTATRSAVTSTAAGGDSTTAVQWKRPAASILQWREWTPGHLTNRVTCSHPPQTTLSGRRPTAPRQLPLNAAERARCVC